MKTGRWLLAIIATLTIFATTSSAAPKVDPELTARLRNARPDALLGVVLTFQGSRVTDAEVKAVEALGINVGVRMRNFPIMGVNASPAQVKQLLGWNELRSIYLNTPLQLYLHQTKPLIGVDRLRKDADITRRNGGIPVSGRNVTIAINDSGVDGTHPDLKFDTLNRAAGQTIQNVLMNPNDKDGLVVRSNTLGNPLKGIVPMTYAEDVVNTDTNGGHGTHVASIAAGTGIASGGLYQGVAPGAKILGIGSGAVLFVLGQVAALDYIYSFHFRDNVRVVNNSWGNSAVELDPDHPVNVASKMLHDDASVVVIFAAGNDGPRPNTQNRWASYPWLISVAAGQKDGRLAGFSSRGLLGDAVVHPTITAPGTGVGSDPFSTSDINTTGLTAAVVGARSRSNVAENGTYDDKQIPAAFLPNYTQISGTSMAAPHMAGVVANILEADPSLLPDETRSIIERTATPLATYDEFEVGAGLANVHAAVDLAFNPSKPYGNFGFTGKGLSLTRADGASMQGSVAPGGSTSHIFEVPANARFTVVQLDWKGVGEDEVVVDNTQIVLHDLALSVSNGQTNASSDGINLAGMFAARESIKLEFPSAGTYTATVTAGLLQQTTVTDQPYTITVTHFVYDPNEVTDISALDAAAREKVYRLVYDRIMFTEGGAFRPGADLTRMELARALMFAARVPQCIPNKPSFTDLAQGTPESLVAESLKREGVMGTSGGAFGAGASVSRVEQAVAMVRALRLDNQAKALANSNVTSGGQVLTDNAQIPGTLRGYVQLALDRGLMEAFPAEVRQVAPGQFQAFPGPRFEPDRVVKRAEFVNHATRLINVMFGE